MLLLKFKVILLSTFILMAMGITSKSIAQIQRLDEGYAFPHSLLSYNYYTWERVAQEGLYVINMRRITNDEGQDEFAPSPILDLYELQDENGNTALMTAVRKGDVEYVEFILQRYRIGESSVPPVYKQIYSSSGELIGSSSALGLYIHRVNNEGFTAMMLAALNCDDKIFELFETYSMSIPNINFSTDVSIIEGEEVTPHTLWHNNCSMYSMK